MKNSGILICLSFMLQACVFYTKPLCTSGVIADIPNFEGSYLLKSYSFEEFEMQKMKVDVSRSANGEYSMNGEPFGRTCRIGGVYYLESLSPDPKTGYSSYRIELFTGESGDKGFQMLLLGASKSELKRRGIPFSIVEVGEGFKKIKEKIVKGEILNSPGKSSNKALLMDNSNLSSDELAQLLEPMSISFTFVPGL